MRTDVIERYQQSLKALGYNPGPIDGVWGPKTAAAARGLAGYLRCQPEDIRKDNMVLLAKILVSLREEAIDKPDWLVDVSGWQNPKRTDYGKAREDGCLGVIVKRSQGYTPSKKGRIHAKLVEEAGDLARGDYHYASFTTPGKRKLSGAIRQAEVFCKEVGDLKPGDIIPWLDIEWRSIKDKVARALYYRTWKAEALTEWALRWLDEVEKRLGVRPGVYTLASYAKHRLTNDERLLESLLWLAGAGGPSLPGDSVPRLEDCTLEAPEPWASWALYQWTGSGKVPWYRSGKGKIDRNVLNGGIETILVPEGLPLVA